MQVHRRIDSLPVFRKSVITIGTFDGVHKGHQKIIAALKAEAQQIGGETVIITFDPHPRKIVRPDEALQLLNTLDEKIVLLQEAGIDHLVVVPFTLAFADQTADEYVADFLVQRFQPHAIIIGYDHHFGKARTGNYKLLEAKAALYNYQLIEIPKHVLDEIDISSTKIRKAILNSDIDTANKLLGYDFFFEGVVVKGDQLGRQLGYPTANLEITDRDKIHVGHGVYATYAEINGRRKKGMLSIGTRPTLIASEEKIEINIFDFDESIYGSTIQVVVKSFLRQQEKYNTLDELVAQLHLDKLNSLKLL